MLKIRRVCVPLGLNCNLHCKYCYRDLEKLDKIPDFSPDMIQYLNNLDPSWCEAVVASGGEPLLYWDKIKELFSYTPKDIHKVIMTNGTLLTQEMVNYINQNDIEVHLSHDGKMTKFLRGVDIFDDEHLLSLCRQIKTIRTFAVVTSYNNDIWENFFNTISRLRRKDIFYDTTIVGSNNIESQQDLLKNFNYDLYFKTLTEYQCSYYYIKNPYKNGRMLTDNPMTNHKIQGGFNVLPNGIICGMTRICSNYGSIHLNSYDKLYENIMRTEDISKCKYCELNNFCSAKTNYISDYTCIFMKKLAKFYSNKDLINSIKNNINSMLPDIERKYGYIEE